MQDKIILLVEDNPNDQELTRWALKKNNIGNTLVIANDGVEALDYLFARGAYAGRDTAAMPTVILLDLNLPKLGGLEVLKAIRNDPRTRLLPVVVLTSSKEDQDVIASYSLGTNGYIQKPVDFVKFNEAILQLGLYWLVLNLTPPIQKGGEA
jgi:two-component system, response regulator